jgi:hypothetical protein
MDQARYLDDRVYEIINPVLRSLEKESEILEKSETRRQIISGQAEISDGLKCWCRNYVEKNNNACFNAEFIIEVFESDSFPFYEVVFPSITKRKKIQSIIKNGFELKPSIIAGIESDPCLYDGVCHLFYAVRPYSNQEERNKIIRKINEIELLRNNLLDQLFLTPQQSKSFDDFKKRVDEMVNI